MEKIVTNRERIIGIRRNNMYANAKATIIEEDGEVQETKKGKERSPEKLYEEKRKVTMKIIENNPTLGNDEASIANIIAKLDNAYSDDIMNNFDAVKYLLFQKGEKYKFLGIIPSERHLVTVDKDGRLFPFISDISLPLD